MISKSKIYYFSADNNPIKHKMKTQPLLVIVIIFLLISTQTLAQGNKDTGRYKEKAREYYSDHDLDNALKYYSMAIEAEMENETPDFLEIGEIYDQMAIINLARQKFTESAELYYKSRENYRKANSWEKVSKNIQHISFCFEQIRKYNQKIEISLREPVKGTWYFRVDSVLRISNDTSWIRIIGGTNDNIKPAGKGEAVSIYNANDDRGNVILGNVYHLSSDNNFSECYVVNTNTDPVYHVRKNDLVALPVDIEKDEEFLLIRQIASMNIQFNDLYNNPVFIPLMIHYFSDTALQNDIFRFMAEDLHSTVPEIEYLAANNPSWKEPMGDGKYSKESMLDAMSMTTPIDISSFLAFVNDYPGKYMGRIWKINETYATWLINFSPAADFDQTFFEELINTDSLHLDQFVKNNAYYITDTIFQRMESTMNYLLENENTEEALILTKRFYRVAELMNNNYYKSAFLIGKANIRIIEEEWNQAIDILNLALQNDSDNLNIWFYRGYAYGQLNDYYQAVQDYKVITEQNPNISVGFGNMSWYLLLDGKIFDARNACLKAYELDSFQITNNVNLGHTYMLLGDTATARKFYDRTLDLVSTITEFNDGPIADFDIFIENGWQKNYAKTAKDYMLKKFNAVYKFRIISDSLETVAKNNDDNKEYAEGLKNMLEAYNIELKSAVPRNDQLYVVTSWIGYLYQQTNDFENAEKYYETCMHYAHDILKSNDKTANVYDLMSWMYDVSGNKAKYLSSIENRDYYRSLKEGQSNDKKLFILAIGQNRNKDIVFDFAENDAIEFTRVLSEKAKNQYDTVISRIITGKELTLNNLENAFKNILLNSKPDDVLVFYFGGSSNPDTSNFLISMSGSDEEPGFVDIDVNNLKTWLSSIEARNQLLLLDVYTPGFIDEFVGSFALSKGTLTTSNLNLGILNLSTHRVEIDTLEHGKFTQSIINLIQNKEEFLPENDKELSIRELNNYLLSQKFSNREILNWNSYFTGNDFVLLSSDSIESATAIATTSPERNRGVGTLNSGFNNNSNFNDETTNYALLFATNTYDEWDNLINPIIDAKALAKTLEEDYGFIVELLTDNTRMDVLAKIREYQKKQYNHNDQLFIFFAGHGSFDEISGEGYIVCKDSKKDDEIKASYIPYSYLRENVNNIRACNHILIALDVCFGGTFDKQVSKFGRSTDIYENISKEAFISRAMKFKSRLFITSGSKEYVADGDPGKHSPFAYNILDVLRSQGMLNGYVTFNMMVQAVERLKTTPRYGDFGDNEPGSEFIFNVMTRQTRQAFKVKDLN